MIDRTRRPRAGEVRAFSFPAFETFQLASGLRVICIPDPRVPLVLLRLICPAGGENDSQGRWGLAALTAALLDEGTTTRSSLELATAVERLGGHLATGADWDSAQIEASVLARDLFLGLELLADVAANPTFPPSELERLKQQTVAHLRRRQMQPAVAASDAFNRFLYREGAYSRPLLGTESSLEGLGRKLVLGHYDQRVRPDGATLVVVGDIEPSQLRTMTEELLSDWSGKALDPVRIPEPVSHTGRRVVLVDREHSPQSEICVGHVGLRRSDPYFISTAVMNSLLGGKFTSRINLNLREQHGYTYGAHSSFARRRGPGPFQVTAAVDNEAVTPAVLEVLHEMERLRDELVSEAELRETVDYLVGSFPYSCETYSGVAARLSEIAVHDLPSDYFSRLPGKLAAVRPRDIRECARAHLHPEHALVVVAGPASEIAGPIAKIAPPERTLNPSMTW